MKINLFDSTVLLSLLDLARLRYVAYRVFSTLFLYPDEGRLVTLRAAVRELQQCDLQAAFAFFGLWQRLLGVLLELTEDATSTAQKVWGYAVVGRL